MAYSSAMIANNILARAFAERVCVTPMKLQKILYFLASEYQKATHQPLLQEEFATWAYGPVLYSVFDEFRTFSKNGISRYARDAEGKSYLIDESTDYHLASALQRVWEATKRRSAVDLSEITHRENSAWDKAYQAGNRFLDSADVQEDRTYQTALGLGILS